MIVGTILVLSVFVLSSWHLSINSQMAGALTVSPSASSHIEIKDVFNTGSFDDLGIYLCRPDTVHATNVYKKTISTASLIEEDDKTSFHPEFHAMKRHNEQWVDLGKGNSDFWIDDTEDSTNYSVAWYLRESAPAAVYCVRCTYDEERDDYIETVDVDFQIVYTDAWTYINVVNNDGYRQISDFPGGSDLTLYLNVTFNDGATDPSLSYTEQTTGATGVKVGAISNFSNIVSLSSMNITVKTISGEVYSSEDVKYEIDSNVNNRVALRLMKPLSNDVYIVQFTSNANNRIVGQFVIDNTGTHGGVNLSQLWVVLMIFGGVLTLGASLVYLVPFFMVKINEIRVYKESERVDRLKNPEKYATKEKKTFKEKINTVVYNLKTPKYKRNQEKKEEEQAKPEEKVYENRFTKMLRERQEKREFMREHNVTSEQMEKMKEAEAKAVADEANSFAFLRDDDDDEIATFHAAEDDISTLEKGAYTQDGTTFAKLDSLRDDEQPTVSDDGSHDDETW